MRKTILFAFALTAAAAPALADTYPVSGAWGQSAGSTKGAISCAGIRVIAFNGNQRTDSMGGVPAYRNKSVTATGSDYRIVDEFSTAQIKSGTVQYTLHQVDADHIEMNGQAGALKLQRCQ